MRRSVGVAIAAFVCLSLLSATAAIAGSPRSSATGAGTDTVGRKFEVSAHNGPQGAQGQMKYQRAPGDTVHADVTCLDVGVDPSGNNIAAVVGTITASSDSLNPVGGTLRF